MAGSHSSPCPLCRSRKGRRACPAKGALICPQCCGSKRRVEIDCPEDCVYLGGAHAGAWDGRETERKRDLRRVAHHLQALSPVQAQLFLLALVGITGLRARRGELSDALLLEAVSALRKTTDTRLGGILYDHAPTDPRAQGLVLDLRRMFEAKGADQAATAPDDRDLQPVLLALERSLAATLSEQEGEAAFLDTAARLAGQIASRPAEGRGPLIVAP
jgi:hypothetical protein